MVRVVGELLDAAGCGVQAGRSGRGGGNSGSGFRSDSWGREERRVSLVGIESWEEVREVPVGCYDWVAEWIDAFGLWLLSHFGDRRSILLFLEFATHDGCGEEGLIEERMCCGVFSPQKVSTS